MSFVHSTIVGHFRPATLGPLNREVTTPIDRNFVMQLISEEFVGVEDYIEFHDGFIECFWASFDGPTQTKVFEFAHEVAKQLNCIAAEMPYCVIEFPEEARLAQQEAWA